MELFIDITLLTFLCITALAITVIRKLFCAVMLAGIFSLLSACLFVSMDAVDVAFTEAAVGTGIATVLMLAALNLSHSREKCPPYQPLLALLVVCTTGAVLVYGTMDLPAFGDATAPIHHHVAPRYIEQSQQEIGPPNFVTSILASYRGYDTLAETVVIFTAGLSVVALLGIRDRRGGQSITTDRSAMKGYLVLRVVTKLLLPFIFLFALYDPGPGSHPESLSPTFSDHSGDSRRSTLRRHRTGGHGSRRQFSGLFRFGRNGPGRSTSGHLSR